MNTEIVVSKSEKLRAALEKTDKALKELDNLTTQTYKTSGIFKYSPTQYDNAGIDIKQVSNVKHLIEIHSFLNNKLNSYTKSAEMLELEEYPSYDWLGFSFEQWNSDIKLRIAVVQQSSKKEQLEKQKKQLESFLTDDDKLDKLLSNIII